MIEDVIQNLFQQKGLGTVVLPIVPVPGGFLHRMYRVETAEKTYAVKHLNPDIMRRPDAVRNMKGADALEQVLFDAGIPVVASIAVGGSKLQELDGAYFYIFPWRNGAITDPDHITIGQCRTAGNILGRIHTVAPRTVEKQEPERSAVDWTGYAALAEAQNSKIAAILKDSEALLSHAQDALNEARAALPGIECITDEDMDPKNVMWDGDEPFVIDLECLEYGNPVSGALQLSLQWAGAAKCDLDFEKLEAFFDGYLDAYDNGFRAYDTVFGLAYTWLEWLAYNVRRALGACADEAEREMGIAEVKNTVARIHYLSENEARIKRRLRLAEQRREEDLLIREATGEEMLRLWGYTNAEEASPTARFFCCNLADGNAVFWTVERDGALIGELYAFFDLEDKDFADGKTTAYLCAFRIRKNFRGQGLGSRLMGTVLNDLRSRGFRRATIGVSDARNERLYRRMGFTETVKDCYLDPCARDEAMQPERDDAGYLLLAKQL